MHTYGLFNWATVAHAIRNAKGQKSGKRGGAEECGEKKKKNGVDREKAGRVDSTERTRR